MTTFLTSDEHYNHANILRLCNRPFLDVADQTNKLIAYHNEVVRPGDDVWHLGDFCWYERDVHDVLRQLVGNHYLVCGNHDACHPAHRKYKPGAEGRYLEYGFAGVFRMASLGPFLLNHLPYTEDDRHGEKYREHRPVDTGGWLAHGHVHGSWQIKDKMVNVGVDAWAYRPVRLDFLVELTGAGK